MCGHQRRGDSLRDHHDHPSRSRRQAPLQLPAQSTRRSGECPLWATRRSRADPHSDGNNRPRDLRCLRGRRDSHALGRRRELHGSFLPRPPPPNCRTRIVHAPRSPGGSPNRDRRALRRSRSVGAKVQDLHPGQHRTARTDSRRRAQWSHTTAWTEKRQTLNTPGDPEAQRPLKRGGRFSKKARTPSA